MRNGKGRVVLLVGLAAALLALQGNPATAQEQLPDHHKAYLTSVLPAPIDVTLQDQFGTLEGVVLNLVMFSPPVEKRLEAGGGISPILNPEDHLTWYEFKGTAPQRKILVTNQFGTDQAWTIGNPKFLLLPAHKLAVDRGLGFEPTLLPPPQGLDHYVCYQAVSGPPPGALVTLTDQFHQEPQVTVGDPVVFCNPADKKIPDDGLPIFDADNHLACYDIVEKVEPPINGVMALDQFGDRVFDVSLPQLLCVPSKKELAPTCPP